MLQTFNDLKWVVRRNLESYLKAASPSDERLRADEHDDQYGDESDASRVGNPWYQSEQARLDSEEPLADGIVVGIHYRVAHHV